GATLGASLAARVGNRRGGGCRTRPQRGRALWRRFGVLALRVVARRGVGANGRQRAEGGLGDGAGRLVQDGNRARLDVDGRHRAADWVGVWLAIRLVCRGWGNGQHVAVVRRVRGAATPALEVRAPT